MAALPFFLTCNSPSGKEPEEKTIDDNDEAAHDAETMKQRQWDEFKEANPRGAGKIGNCCHDYLLTLAT